MPQTSNTNLIVAIGASAGGFAEIIKIVESLPAWFSATLVVATHRTPRHENMLAKILSGRARVQVDEPEDEDAVECTRIYVGHADETVEVEGDEFDVEVDTSRYARMHRIDDLFKSVADSAGQNSVGVILSGMLRDGTEGLLAIREAGGRCVVQTPADAKYDSMPLSALAHAGADFMGNSEQIAGYLLELALEDPCDG